MDSVDILAKLYKLKGSLDALCEDDRIFVVEMVKVHERGELLSRHQVLQIVNMSVPGEPSQPPNGTSEDPTVQTYDMVNVVSVSSDEVIWRYMPLEQLFALLSKKSLHFSPLPVMGDTTEGQLPRKAWEQTKKELAQNTVGSQVSLDDETITAIMVAQRRTDACINCGTWMDRIPLRCGSSTRQEMALQFNLRFVV